MPTLILLQCRHGLAILVHRGGGHRRRHHPIPNPIDPAMFGPLVLFLLLLLLLLLGLPALLGDGPRRPAQRLVLDHDRMTDVVHRGRVDRRRRGPHRDRPHQQLRSAGSGAAGFLEVERRRRWLERAERPSSEHGTVEFGARG